MWRTASLLGIGLTLNRTNPNPKFVKNVVFAGPCCKFADLHIVNASQREIPRKIRLKHIQRDIQNKLIICYKGRVVRGVCVCDQNYIGKFCEREMHCLGFERTENGSPKCRHGGKENNYTQKCQCISPHSGVHCEVLRVEDVYYHYNTRAYIIGPIGVLLIIPMICIIKDNSNSDDQKNHYPLPFLSTLCNYM
uniref:EGF-like domain-containing protein n=1 Tax=Meloidogyne javanica TaxID=6303 RepID=A0A915M7U1_MELJA